MDVIQQQAKLYCNRLAIEKGLDPVGNAASGDDWLLIEAPLPWKKDVYQQVGSLPQEMIDLLALWLERYRAGQGYRHRSLMIAPDPEYSRPGFRRVMYYTRPVGAFAHFDKVEYLVPESEAGALVWALYEARDDLPRFEHYRVCEADRLRDILVCTHGTVDAACAKFGYPLYRDVRDHHAVDDMRVWRVSHFGGHVFAPTMIEMPTAHYWAYVEAPQAEQIANRRGDVAALRGHYRGWSGLEGGFLQAAERELWQQYGWEWFRCHKTSEILVQDSAELPQWAEVRICFTAPDDSIQGQIDMRVEVHDCITTITTTGNEHTHDYPQYVVTTLSMINQTGEKLTNR
jgi:hypothetical protein